MPKWVRVQCDADTAAATFRALGQMIGTEKRGKVREMSPLGVGFKSQRPHQEPISQNRYVVVDYC
jgi:hypothetical protein